MVIEKKNIAKYIFDPNNPQQCKSYKELKRIAEKENYSFFSPDFLKYFFESEILNDKFKNELWDIPENYLEFSFIEKIALYVEQLSNSDLEDFKNSIDKDNINTEAISKYQFFSKLIDVKYMNSIGSKILYDTKKFSNYIFEEIFKTEERSYLIQDTLEHNKHFILFVKSDFALLNLNIIKSSIIITLEENIDEFLENYINTDIKPIFLKKIEDVDLLLNVLEEDLNTSKAKMLEKEEISSIDSIEIKDFFSINHLKLENLQDKKEIYILGENGDGKTLLLQAIAIALKGVEKDGQEKFREKSKVFDLKLIDSHDTHYRADKNSFYKNMFAYGVSRNTMCKMKNDDSGYLTLFEESNVKLKNPMEWIKDLDSLERYKKELKEEVILPIVRVINIIESLLEDKVTIEVNPKEITFTERGSKKVEFERLSAGYKGIITIICDMLDRLSTNQPYIKEVKKYQGIVVIDEVELHLHPKWEYDFMQKLRNIFPLIQFIVTTHSPTVILGASEKAVFYKIYKVEGEVYISHQIKNKGYTNNSLVSSPLFDMDNFASREYPNDKLSDDDYVYNKIHERVGIQIKENINLSEEEILKLIDKELENI